MSVVTINCSDSTDFRKELFNESELSIAALDGTDLLDDPIPFCIVVVVDHWMELKIWIMVQIC